MNTLAGYRGSERRLLGAGVLVCLIVSTGLEGCDGLRNTKELPNRYTEKVRQKKKALESSEELVRFFDTSWQAVAWEVVAEKRLGNFLNEKSPPVDLALSIDFVEQCDREARNVFFRRYGVEPPEKYFPPLLAESIIGEAFNASAVYQQGRWPQILREAGLVEAQEIPAYLERWRKDEAARQDLKQRVADLASRLNISEYDAYQVVEVGDLMSTLATGQVEMRLLPHVHQLDPLLRHCMVEALLSGSDTVWRLTPMGRAAAGTGGKVCLGWNPYSAIPIHHVVGPPIYDRYVGVGRVVKKGLADALATLVGGRQAGRPWIAVEMLAGVSHWRRPYYAGQTIPAVAATPWVHFDSILEVGDLVGYRETSGSSHPDGEHPESHWEKIDPAALNALNAGPASARAFGCSDLKTSVTLTGRAQEAPARNLGVVKVRSAYNNN